jgi:hypothetical protein
MFCALVLFFVGSEDVGSRFNVLCFRTHFQRFQGRRDPFHVLLARTCFRRYRGRRVPLSYFALPDSFSALPRALVPVFMFCAPGLISRSTEGVGSHFYVLHARTRFWRYRRRRVRFHVLPSRTCFRRYRGRRVPFSCFALRDSFSTVRRASGPVFMFYAPGLVFGGIKGVGAHFQVLRSIPRFRR